MSVKSISNFPVASITMSWIPVWNIAGFHSKCVRKKLTIFVIFFPWPREFVWLFNCSHHHTYLDNREKNSPGAYFPVFALQSTLYLDSSRQGCLLSLLIDILSPPQHHRGYTSIHEMKTWMLLYRLQLSQREEKKWRREQGLLIFRVRTQVKSFGSCFCLSTRIFVPESKFGILYGGSIDPSNTSWLMELTVLYVKDRTCWRYGVPGFRQVVWSFAGRFILAASCNSSVLLAQWNLCLEWSFVSLTEGCIHRFKQCYMFLAWLLYTWEEPGHYDLEFFLQLTHIILLI